MNADVVKQLPFVETCLLFDEIDSTNTMARELAAIPLQGMHIIWAARQRAGRGRRERSFFSAIEGGLWVSIVVPITTLDAHFHINRGLSVAIGASTCAGRASIALKWPNDVYLNNRKICGILLESIPGHPNGIVAGFGLNVNIRPEEFPQDLAGIATSLVIETGHEHDCSALLSAILRRFEHYRHADAAHVHIQYLGRLYKRGHQVALNDIKGIFEEVCIDGRIGIRTDTGMSYFSSGDIRFID
jgi:BirA family biotin operon repressor/biotin-[acetyl-CoA-carboxylase] ligase